MLETGNSNNSCNAVRKTPACVNPTDQANLECASHQESLVKVGAVLHRLPGALGSRLEDTERPAVKKAECCPNHLGRKRQVPNGGRFFSRGLHILEALRHETFLPRVVCLRGQRVNRVQPVGVKAT